MSAKRPILYSFRRCPYAMRARLALAVAGIEVELREVLLRDKPAELLAASAKATVPVLRLVDGSVLDESRAIMRWALSSSDPLQWLGVDLEDAQALIEQCDGPFKQALDGYKYFQRHPQHSQTGWRDEASGFLNALNDRIQRNGGGLSRSQLGLADYAILPFVRQFAGVDADWFEAQAGWAPLRQWRSEFLASRLFARVMGRYQIWQPGQAVVVEDWTGPQAGSA